MMLDNVKSELLLFFFLLFFPGALHGLIGPRLSYAKCQ